MGIRDLLHRGTDSRSLELRSSGNEYNVQPKNTGQTIYNSLVVKLTKCEEDKDCINRSFNIVFEQSFSQIEDLRSYIDELQQLPEDDDASYYYNLIRTIINMIDIAESREADVFEVIKQLPHQEYKNLKNFLNKLTLEGNPCIDRCRMVMQNYEINCNNHEL